MLPIPPMKETRKLHWYHVAPENKRSTPWTKGDWQKPKCPRAGVKAYSTPYNPKLPQMSANRSYITEYLGIGKAISFEGPAVDFFSGEAFTTTSTLTSTKKVNPKNKQNLRNLTSVEFVLEIWEGMNLKNKYPKNQRWTKKPKPWEFLRGSFVYLTKLVISIV